MMRLSILGISRWHSTILPCVHINADMFLWGTSFNNLNKEECSLVIVGGDSLIGRQLLIECAKIGIATQASTRRNAGVSCDRFFLDLAAPRPEQYLPKNSHPILIVAAQTSYDACENNPASAKINIDAPLLLASAALTAGRRVIFVSTNSVFGGNLPLCNEDDKVMPQAAYSKQKAEAEQRLSALPRWSSHGSIVRLTKVLSPSTPPIAAWREALSRGEPILPFSDMIFSPISIQFAARSLIQVALSHHCGNFHFSGSSDLTYAEFAYRYVEMQKLSPDLVIPTTAAHAGVHLLFNPRYSSLGMTRTQQLMGTFPQRLSDVINDLLQAEKNNESVF